jgi:hypothetical protein
VVAAPVPGNWLAAVMPRPSPRLRPALKRRDVRQLRAIAGGSCCVVPSLSNRDGSGGIRQQKAAGPGRPHRYSCTCFSHPDFNCRYRNFTGSTVCRAFLAEGTGSRVADCHRRFGLTPTPEHVCVLLLCHNRRGLPAIPQTPHVTDGCPGGGAARWLRRDRQHRKQRNRQQRQWRRLLLPGL